MENSEIVISKVNGQRAYDDFFAKGGHGRQDLASGVMTIVDAATILSLEASWPTLLELSRRAAEGEIRLKSGWTIRSVNVPSRAHSAFTLEHEDTPGGFLFDVELRLELTEDAKARIAAVSAAKEAVVDAIADAEVREAARQAMRSRPSDEVTAIKVADNSYGDPRECTNASAVACYVYRADGLFPPGYCGTGSELGETLAMIGQNSYMSGKLFRSRMSLHLQFGEMPSSMVFDPSGYVRDPAMAITVFEILVDVLDELEMLDGIGKRMKDTVSGLTYSHTVNNPDFGLLLEMGFATVRSWGLPGESLLSTAVHFWTAAAAIDVANAAWGIFAPISKLVSHDHVTENAPFEFGNREAFVLVTDGNGVVSLWIGSGGCENGYRVDLTPGNEDLPPMIKAAIVSRKDLPGEEPNPEMRGFLFEFEDQGGGGYWPLEVGEFEARTLNGVRHLCDLIDNLKDMAGKVYG